MTKKQACNLLSISPKTLERRMASGRYKFTRTGEGQYAELSFTFADLGLPEPAPAPAVPEPTPAQAVPVPTPEPAQAVPVPTPEPKFAPTPLGPIELKREEDERFAQDFKSGEATDSLGNHIDGTNAKWPTKGAQSLVGCKEHWPEMQKGRADTTSHMTSPVAGGERVENPVDSDAYHELLHPGHADRKAKMYAECGLRPLSEHEKKQRLDRMAIDAAFGWSR